MKKYILFFLLLLISGCGSKGSDNLKKLSFLNKADEYQRMRNAYADSISRNPAKRGEFLNKQIELNETIKKMETYQDWPASDTIKNKFIKAFPYDTVFTLPGKDSMEILYSKTSFGIDRLEHSIGISKAILDEREKILKNK